MTDAKNESREIARRLAMELHDIAQGCYVKDANGEQVLEDEYTPEDGEEPEPYTLCDYLEDSLDARYMVDSYLDYLGVRITIAWGGPNVYVDTFRGSIEVFWGGDHEEWTISPETIADIDELYREYYACARC